MNSKNRLFYSSRKLCFGFAAVLFGLGADAAYAETVWQAYTYNPVATSESAKGFVKIVERIEEETNGELKINFHTGGSLQIEAGNITQAVSDNIVQLADDAFFAGSVPLAGLVRLPMLIKDDAEFAAASEIMDPYVEEGYANWGVEVLGTYYYSKLVAFSREPLSSLDDFEGQMIRTPSPEYGEFVKTFGATTITMGVPEVAAALDRGVVDGVVTSSSLGGYAWRDSLKYNYRIGISYPTSNIIVNKSALEELPPEIQEIVRRVVMEVAPTITQNLADRELELTAQLEEEGMTITTPSDEEIERAEKAIAPYWDSWAEERGPDAVEALKKVRSALGG